MASDDLRAGDAEERGQGICRTCLMPIWNEGGTVGRVRREEGWSDRIERGGDSLVCFKAADYRHVPLTGREAGIYDGATRAVLAVVQPELDRLTRERDEADRQAGYLMRLRDDALRAAERECDEALAEVARLRAVVERVEALPPRWRGEWSTPRWIDELAAALRGPDGGSEP